MDMRYRSEVQAVEQERTGKGIGWAGAWAAAVFVAGSMMVGLPIGIALSMQPGIGRIVVAIGAAIGGTLLAGMLGYLVMVMMRYEWRRLQRMAANEEAWWDHLREGRRQQEPASLDEIERLVESVPGRVRAELVQMLDAAINLEGRMITVEMIEDLSRQAKMVASGLRGAERPRRADVRAPQLSAQGQFVRTLRARLNRSC